MNTTIVHPGQHHSTSSFRQLSKGRASIWRGGQTSTSIQPTLIRDAVIREIIRSHETNLSNVLDTYFEDEGYSGVFFGNFPLEIPSLKWISVPTRNDHDPFSNQGIIDVATSLQVRLGLPLQMILKIAGIAPRTFYKWRENPTIRPRVASNGYIWRLAQLVDDLEYLVPDLHKWISNPNHRKLLKARKFQKLTELAERESRPVSSGKIFSNVIYSDDSILETVTDLITPPQLKHARNLAAKSKVD